MADPICRMRPLDGSGALICGRPATRVIRSPGYDGGSDFIRRVCESHAFVVLSGLRRRNERQRIGALGSPIPMPTLRPPTPGLPEYVILAITILSFGIGLAGTVITPAFERFVDGILGAFGLGG
jgi:hypothetical protein